MKVCYRELVTLKIINVISISSLFDLALVLRKHRFCHIFYAVLIFNLISLGLCPEHSLVAINIIEM